MANLRGYKHYKRNAQDLKVVRNMVLLGSTEEMIAECLGKDGIDVKTLRSHYPEMKKYREQMLASIADKAYQMAKKGDKTMICFVLKCRGGWKESDELIHKGRVQIVKRVIGVADAEV